jgi:hypothetical protein
MSLKFRSKWNTMFYKLLLDLLERDDIIFIDIHFCKEIIRLRELEIRNNTFNKICKLYLIK